MLGAVADVVGVVVRLILGGTVVKARLNRKATISLLVVLGVRGAGQKVLLAVRNIGGKRPEVAWHGPLDDLLARVGCARPNF